uniref:Uncharacterized protein n=1 Tax=Tetranychus urticae TaxID=32264 RepID=T1JYM2_TETUR
MCDFSLMVMSTDKTFKTRSTTNTLSIVKQYCFRSIINSGLPKDFVLSGQNMVYKGPKFYVQALPFKADSLSSGEFYESSSHSANIVNLSERKSETPPPRPPSVYPVVKEEVTPKPSIFKKVKLMVKDVSLHPRESPIPVQQPKKLPPRPAYGITANKVEVSSKDEVDQAERERQKALKKAFDEIMMKFDQSVKKYRKKAPKPSIIQRIKCTLDFVAMNLVMGSYAVLHELADRQRLRRQQRPHNQSAYPVKANLKPSIFERAKYMLEDAATFVAFGTYYTIVLLAEEVTNLKKWFKNRTTKTTAEPVRIKALKEYKISATESFPLVPLICSNNNQNNLICEFVN